MPPTEPLIHNTTHLRDILHTLPEQPGVYQYFDATDKIIYIGKAKNLKKRVSSYFNKNTYDNAKLRMLVSKIHSIRYIIVDTEFDAFLLENTLIKKHQPRYNVLLKDDKTFPWICIKKEPFPRVFPTRNPVRDGSEYYGPYASVRTMNVLLELISQIYPLRNCNYNLSEENIRQKKFKVCLQYHIGKCKAPCTGLQNSDDYNETIRQIRSLVKGHISSVIQELKELMKRYAAEYAYEKAQMVKEKLGLITNYQSKSTVVSATISNVDVFSITADDSTAFVNYFKVINGAVAQSHTLELKKKLEEKPEELLTLAITDIRLRFKSDAREIIVPFALKARFPNTRFTVPKMGEKKQLLELSERNVKYYMFEKKRQQMGQKKETPAQRILATLKTDLRMEATATHIECFDISNMQGGDSVASMVVFRHAMPSKKDYRIFNIRTVTGPNDFASIEEVVYRRYKRILDEAGELPQLIIVDGGKGQLSAAVKSLEKLKLLGKITIIGIAKRLEEIFFPGDSIPLYLDKRTESLKLIQNLRNEAHRFGIKHHRKKAEKRVISSELTGIKSIGPKTTEALFKTFKSVEAIRMASFEALEQCVGAAKAKVVKAYLAGE